VGVHLSPRKQPSGRLHWTSRAPGRPEGPSGRNVQAPAAIAGAASPMSARPACPKKQKTPDRHITEEGVADRPPARYRAGDHLPPILALFDAGSAKQCIGPAEEDLQIAYPDVWVHTANRSRSKRLRVVCAAVEHEVETVGHRIARDQSFHPKLSVFPGGHEPEHKPEANSRPSQSP